MTPEVVNAAAELRLAAGKVDALAAVTMEAYDNVGWHDVDRKQINRIAHLLGETAEAASALVVKTEWLCALVADQEPADAKKKPKRSSRR